ncbi:hypothetical protein D7W82_08645 [Corallococcus sp. CA049B]|uniref:hypothetical protein n=1 Tax=Corallococcus sp. CA049B TaxID=2316730 RepID=UPI000EA101EC|nr:hypothetical protein [Corallococcus sp. CA049B]NOJ93207.1 hypothetical protein [Corallococcus coralloides]RKG89027.1 hypothetical protein D7W82_08645 [Corallococcus sp. CA049B]
MLRRLPLVFALATAPTLALAQEGDWSAGRAPTDLDGVGRITVQAGYRLTSNGTLYDAWYGAKGPGNGLERAPESSGGPLGVATFAYAMSDLVEVGIDLFGTAQTLRLSEPGPDGTTVSRKVSTVSYGALLGVRFQGVLDIGPQGLIPSAGVLTGPAVISSTREGSSIQERVSQAWVGSLGATLRLSAEWGITAEYRFMLLRGPVESPDAEAFKGPFSFSHGGNWFALGVTYAFPPNPSRPMASF